MNFDFWTILFQIINFFVLLYILKRLLFKPVKEIMQKRKEQVERTISDAEAAKKEAAEMKEKCRQEMEGLADLKTRMTEKMKGEVERERAKLIEEAKEKARVMVEKEKAIMEKDRKKFEEDLKSTAVDAVSVLAARLLGGVSDGDLHRSIYEKLLNEAGRIAAHITEAGKGQAEVTVEISSAYPLSEEEKRRFAGAIESRVDKKVNLRESVDGSLIGGARVSVYDMVFDSSLKGQIESMKQKLKEASR